MRFLGTLVRNLNLVGMDLSLRPEPLTIHETKMGLL